ncbi:hypothetical protein AB0I94_39185 [Streptomyces sp. NPDC050147]|uniref:hypothetical protein n=1 Tax=Streptomyces sp. NPDC050147 TaxID=3155513 RepID=UPI003449C045
MRDSSWAVVPALTLSLLCAAPAAAAAEPRATHLPGDVTANQCIRGGGMIIISADSEGTGRLRARCQGGIHNGETIT